MSRRAHWRCFAVLAAAFAIAAILLVQDEGPTSTEANHGWKHDQGIGYDGLGPNTGSVALNIDPSHTSLFNESLVAMDNWRALAYDNLSWLRQTSFYADVNQENGGATVIDRGAIALGDEAGDGEVSSQGGIVAPGRVRDGNH